ncbi:MAG TPA: tetratricopeptide repeat protein [Pirellulales bacterium]|nr:tetratricopeptide repeat protein [Pirellulales bacterium]
MTFKVTLLSLAQGSLLLMLAGGCSASAIFANKQGIQTTTYAGPNQPPGPMKQLASKVSNSSLGQSVSKVFHNASAKKRKLPTNAPPSLADKLKPPDADFHVDAGNMCVKDNDPENARINYHKALEMKPHHLGALLGLARLFDRQGQMERATEHYLEATKYHPSEAAAYNDLGLCYARQAKYDDAVKALSRAVELQPDRALYRNNIATVLVVQGRIDEALAHLTDAHGAAIANYNVGFLLNKRGQSRQALEQFSLALQADPSMTSAQQWVESLSSELAPESRQPVQIASGMQPSETVEDEPLEGPRLGPSQTPPTAGARSLGLDEQFEPQDQVESSANPPGEAEPSDASQAISSDRSSRSGVKRPAGDASPDMAAEPAEKEAELQYLPPVTPRTTSPSRY